MSFPDAAERLTVNVEFEAFSLDESTYARVSLPHSATKSNRKPSCGTTNIDFSVSLERELARTRNYRPLHLTVGSDSVGVDTGVSSTVEKKIDLPEVDGSRVEPYIAKAAIIEQFELFKEICVLFKRILKCFLF